MGDLCAAIHVCIPGRKPTPPLFDLVVASAYETTIDRLQAAIELAATLPGVRGRAALARHGVQQAGYGVESRHERR